MARVIQVRSDGRRDFTCDVACDRCGEDDSTTERQRPTDTKREWLCQLCAYEYEWASGH